MHRSLPRAACAALLLLGGCNESTAPIPGGEYRGVLESPFSAEGAALIELTHVDLRSVSAPGRILVARGVSERTVRVLILDPPRNQHGGPITFVVRMAEGAAPPAAEVLAVAAPDNRARDFTGGYAVRFTRRSADAALPAELGPGAGEPGPVPLARLVAPLFPGGRPLHPEEQARVDVLGNGNGVFDLGDVRGYLFWYPSQIPVPAPWTR